MIVGSFLPTRQYEGSFAIICVAILVLGGSGAALLLSDDPRLLLLLPLAVTAASIGFYLLHRPLTALYLALLLNLMPYGLLPFLDDITPSPGLLSIILAFGAWLIHTVPHRRPIFWNGICLSIILYMLWASATLSWAPDIVAGRRLLVAYGIGFLLFFLIVNQVRSPAALDGLMRALRIAGWIVVAAGMYSIIFTDFHFGERLTVFAINDNLFALFLVVMLPGVIWPVLRASGAQRSRRMLASVLYVICATVLVLLSGSRGGLLSLVLTLVLFGFARSTRRWSVVSAVIALLMLTSAPFLLDTLENRFNEDWGDAVGARDVLWDAGVHFIEDHPFTGAGVGNAPALLRPYIASLTSDFEKRDDLPSHNPFIEVACDTGLFGLMLYASIFIAAIWQFLHRLRSAARRQAFGGQAFLGYYPMIFFVAVGFFASFIKGGGLEANPVVFLVLALLAIPSQLPDDVWTKQGNASAARNESGTTNFRPAREERGSAALEMIRFAGVVRSEEDL